MDTDTSTPESAPSGGIIVRLKKAPRKPRPSEIAAKEAKKVKVMKKLKKKTAAKKKVAKRKPAKKAAANGAGVRSERLDMRLTKAEKAKIYSRAKKLRRTVTSIVTEAIEKIK